MRAIALNPFRFLLPALILLVSAAIQFHALVQDVRFYPDEALFSTFARNAALNGDWLLHGSLDKTPLSIYASALSMTFVAAQTRNGVLDFDPRMGEFAARLPNVLASIIFTAVIYALAQRLYGRRSVSVWAAIFAAFSPFLAVFGATAFTDPLMLMLAGLAVLMAARGKWLWSGVWLALAFAAKQQALYLLPLVLLIGWVTGGITLRRLLTFAAPQIVGVLVLLGWDALRAQESSLWALAATNNNPDRFFVRADEVAPRLAQWFGYGRVLIGTPTLILGGTALIMVGSGSIRAPRRRGTLTDTLLLVYLLAYFLAHWLIAFNIYPRYLLPLLIPAALLGARTVIWLWMWLRQRLGGAEGIVLAAALIFTLATGARGASEHRAELSEDGNDYRGIIALADYLNAQSLGAVIYDHWLGWELGYYMGLWNDKRRVYYPTPEALLADALKLGDPAPRYFPAPSNQPLDPWLDALRANGFAVDRVYAQESFIVYRIIPPFP